MRNLLQGQNSSRRTRAERRGLRVVLWYASLIRAKAIASCRYRIGNLAEVGSGLNVVIAERLPGKLLGRTDVLVILRPYPTAGVKNALRVCGQLGIPCLADFDDLLFAGSPQERPEVVGGRLTSGWMERAQRAYAELLPAFDAFLVATTELALELQRTRPGAPVFVVPNGLSPSWVAQGRALYPRWKPSDRKIIRFFPGSPTHDASFESIAPALAEFLRTHPEVCLEVVGNLRWDAKDLAAPHRVRHRPPVPYEHLAAFLASAWVNLWPRTDTRFNRCKSPIKFFEAAAFGCPTIAAECCRRSELECAGLSYARTQDEWWEALDRLMDDERRKRASEACLRYADERAGAMRGWIAMRDALATITPGSVG